MKLVNIVRSCLDDDATEVFEAPFLLDEEEEFQNQGFLKELQSSIMTMTSEQEEELEEEVRDFEKPTKIELPKYSLPYVPDLLDLDCDSNGSLATLQVVDAKEAFSHFVLARDDHDDEKEEEKDAWEECGELFCAMMLDLPCIDEWRGLRETISDYSYTPTFIELVLKNQSYSSLTSQFVLDIIIQSESDSEDDHSELEFESEEGAILMAHQSRATILTDLILWKDKMHGNIDVIDVLEKLRASASNERDLACVNDCINMVRSQNGKLRAMETYLMKNKRYGLLQRLVPEFQSQLLISESGLCEDDPYLRNIAKHLMDPRTGRILLIERVMAPISLVLDAETGLIIFAPNPPMDAIQTICQWIGTTGVLAYQKLWVLLIQPVSTMVSISLLCACTRLSEKIPVTVRMLRTEYDVATFIRHLMLHHSQVAHSERFPSTTNPTLDHQFLLETVHETFLNTIPSMNPFKAFRIIRSGSHVPLRQYLHQFLDQKMKEAMEEWVENLLTEEHALKSVRSLPSVQEIESLCSKAIEVLGRYSTSFVEVSCPITIVGDIHGQLFDLLEMLRVGGPAPDTNYLFLGDYVDRGFYSVETILLLLTLKVKYPDHITLLRGNHETRQITQVYGFYDECVRKFNGHPVVWKAVTAVFDVLPVTALITGGNKRVLAVHAGLSPTLSTLDEIRSLKYNAEVPHEGPVCDLLWSDPDEGVTGWAISQRGAGYIFGEDVVRAFNQTNNLDLIARSHQLVMEGYKEIFGKQLVTVWSAANYCYRCGNDAAILDLDINQYQYHTFSGAPDAIRSTPAKDKSSVSIDYFM